MCILAGADIHNLTIEMEFSVRQNFHKLQNDRPTKELSECQVFVSRADSIYLQHEIGLKYRGHTYVRKTLSSLENG